MTSTPEASQLHLLLPSSTTISYVMEADVPISAKLKSPMPLSDLLLCKVLEEDVNAGDVMDLTFVCVDGEVKAHRLIIAAASNFLAQLLADFDQDNCTSATIILPDVKVDVMEAVRTLCYSGVTNYPSCLQDNVYEVMNMLLIGDQGNFVASVLEPVLELETAESDFDSLTFSFDMGNLSGKGSWMMTESLHDAVIEELVKTCCSGFHKKIVADAVEQFERTQRNCEIERDEVNESDIIKISEELAKSGSAAATSSIPNYPSLEIEKLPSQPMPMRMRGPLIEKSTQTGENEMLGDTETATKGQIPNKKGRKRKSTTSVPERRLKESIPSLKRRKGCKSAAAVGTESAADMKILCAAPKPSSTIPPKEEKNNGLQRRLTRHQLRRLEEKRNSITSISSNEDLFMPVKVRKKDKKYLLTPSKLQKQQKQQLLDKTCQHSTSKKPRPSLDFSKIGKLYTSLGVLTSKKSDSSSPSPSSAPITPEPVTPTPPCHIQTRQGKAKKECASVFRWPSR